MSRFGLVFVVLCLAACGGIAENSRNRGAEDTDDGAQNDGTEDDRIEDLGPPPDCSGDFAEPEVLFEEPGWIAQALTPAANGLEFFYARLAVDLSLDDSGMRVPTLRTRPSEDADFGPPVILTLLTSACEEARTGTEFAGFDLSLDGKRLYMTCSAFAREPGSSGPLLMFERDAFGEPFERPPTVVGEVGISVGLTRDELTAYGTSLDPSINAVVRYHRDSLTEPFGPAEAVPGVTRLANPEPSPDGQALFGILGVPETLQTQVVAARWHEETLSYLEPAAVLAPPPEGASDVSPALQSDCRAVYFSRIVRGTQQISRVMVAKR